MNNRFQTLVHCLPPRTLFIQNPFKSFQRVGMKSVRFKKGSTHPLPFERCPASTREPIPINLESKWLWRRGSLRPELDIRAPQLCQDPVFENEHYIICTPSHLFGYGANVQNRFAKGTVLHWHAVFWTKFVEIGPAVETLGNFRRITYEYEVRLG